MRALRLGGLLAGGVAVVAGAYAAGRPWAPAAPTTGTHAPVVTAAPLVAPKAPVAAAAAASASAPPAPLFLAPPQDIESLNTPYDGRLHFVRLMYNEAPRGFGRFGGRGPMWAHDYPRGERNFMRIIDEMTDIRPLVDGSNILAMDDPRLFKFPIAYVVEVGSWQPTDTEIEGLSQYLRKGGFLIVDDFRDPWNLSAFMGHMGRVLPGIQFVELDGSHEIFDSFFRVDPHQVVPPYGPQTPVWYGLFEDNDPEKRLMVIVNYDNDISEYWEFSDMGYYPIDLSNEAYKLGVNYLVYALTH